MWKQLWPATVAGLFTFVGCLGKSKSDDQASHGTQEQDTQGPLTLIQDTDLFSGWGTTVANTCQGVKIQGIAVKNLVINLTLKSTPGSTFYTDFDNHQCQRPVPMATMAQVTLKTDVVTTEIYFKAAPSATSLAIDAITVGTPPIPSLTLPIWPVTLQLTGESVNGGKYRPGVCGRINVENFVPTKAKCLVPDGTLAVNLALKAGEGAALYSDNLCSTTTTSMTIDGSGNGSGSCGGFVYLKDPNAGDTAVITATAPGYTTPTTLIVNYL